MNGASRDLVQAIREAAGPHGLSPLLHETRRLADFPKVFDNRRTLDADCAVTQGCAFRRAGDDADMSRCHDEVR